MRSCHAEPVQSTLGARGYTQEFREADLDWLAFYVGVAKNGTIRGPGILRGIATYRGLKDVESLTHVAVDSVDCATASTGAHDVGPKGREQEARARGKAGIEYVAQSCWFWPSKLNPSTLPSKFGCKFNNCMETLPLQPT